MKKIILTITLFASTFGFAQRLESKIPANAQAVISINGDNLLELISLADFDTNTLGKEIIKEVSRKNPDFNSLGDLGIHLESKAFYFYQPTDSISYHNFMVNLKDRNAFEQILDSATSGKIVKTGSTSSFVDYTSSVVWNDNTLLFTVGEKSYSYFKDREDKIMEQAENEMESRYQIERRIASGWTSDYSNKIFNYSGASILSNKNYLKSIDNKAAASVWINSYGQLINGFMGNLKYILGGLKPNYNNMGIGSMNANLYFEKNATRLTYEMEVNDKWKKAIKRMYRSRMDNAFFRYFNENEIIGYTSIAMNTEAVLQEYPNLMSEIYGGMLPELKEETAVAAELFSLIIDEKAIGELITGNMLFIMNDIGEKEVTYTTYEYDEDYNETEVEKTKKEMSPDFTIMIGSENEKLLFKVIKLGVKHKALEQNANYYKLNMPNKVPFDLYAVIKDEIVFITSSEKQLANIISPRPVSNVGGHKRTIRRNAAVVYLDIKKMLAKIPAESLRSNEKKMISYATNNFNNAYYTSGKMKRNNMVSELVIETADNRENSLKVLLDFIDFMM